MSSSSEDGRSTRQRTPAVARQRAVALAAARAEARRDRVGRAQQQAVGPRAVAVGHDHDLSAPLGASGGRVEQRVELARVQRRAVAGNAQHALDALCERASDAERHRRGLALLAAVGDDLGAVLARGLQQAVLAA